MRNAEPAQLCKRISKLSCKADGASLKRRLAGQEDLLDGYVSTLSKSSLSRTTSVVKTSMNTMNGDESWQFFKLLSKLSKKLSNTSLELRLGSPNGFLDGCIFALCKIVQLNQLTTQLRRSI
jgi:hypothetical protein